MPLEGGQASPEVEGVSRRRFVQVCLGVATATAVGSTLASIIGIRPTAEVPSPPSATEAVSVCPVCSVGCGLLSSSSGGEALPARGDPRSSHTAGMLCTRGALLPAGAWPATLTSPLRRRSPTTKGQPPEEDHFEAIAWDEALDDINRVMLGAGTLAKGCILGPDVAMEDAYVAARLFKGVISSPYVDSVETLHSRSIEEAYRLHMGEPAPPTCYDDVGLASLIVVLGEDIATTHPVLYAMVAEAVHSGGVELVVADPRVTDTAIRTRCTHVPVRAGGEVALLNAIGSALVHEIGSAPSQWARENAENADAFAEFLKLYAPAYDENERVEADFLVALCDGDSSWVEGMGNRDGQGYLKSFDVPTITGLDPETVRQLARKWGRARSVLTIIGSRLGGAGDGGAAPSAALDLHLLTGHVGRPGAGVLGLQATASGRGANDAGATSLGLPGNAPGGTETSPVSLEAAWGATAAYEATRLPPGPGPVGVLQKARAGEMASLLLLGGTVTPTIPDAGNLVASALRSTFVVSTAAHLEDPDVAHADLVLPRPSWYQREAHFAGSARHVARSLPSMAAPDGCRPEWEVLSRIGSAWTADPPFEYASSTEVVEEMRRGTEGTPADLSRLPLGDALTDARGVQWPVATSRAAELGGTARRHMGQDGRSTGFPTASGKALIVPREHPGLRQAINPEYPYTAVVSIDPASWWDGLMYLPAGAAMVRGRVVGEDYVELSPDLMEELGLSEGGTVWVRTPYGEHGAPVRQARPGGALGHVFLPWGTSGGPRSIVPNFPLDAHGVPPWTSFAVGLATEPAITEEGSGGEGQ